MVCVCGGGGGGKGGGGVIPKSAKKTGIFGPILLFLVLYGPFLALIVPFLQ